MSPTFGGIGLLDRHRTWEIGALVTMLTRGRDSFGIHPRKLAPNYSTVLKTRGV